MQNLERGTTRAALSHIQQQLQQKDEEMAWIDSCCLQLIVRSRSGKEEKFTFQTESPEIRKDWVIGNELLISLASRLLPLVSAVLTYGQTWPLAQRLICY